MHQYTFEKGSTIIGKNLLPTRANYLLLEDIPFQNGAKSILTELSSLNVYQLPLGKGGKCF